MTTLKEFCDVILSSSDAAIRADSGLGGKLRLAAAGRIAIDYAPFEHVEPKAKVVIVGITPGSQQAANALCEARRVLLAGKSEAEAARAAKVTGSFSGPLRSNLVALLDFIGVAKILSLETTARLWADRSDLVHFTSALRYPVYLDGKNYSGNPSIVSTPILTSMVTRHLAEEAEALENAIWVPLGPAASTGVELLIARQILKRDNVILGLPHPSGANAERIAYFLGRKQRSELSSRTSPQKIDAAREAILKQVAALRNSAGLIGPF